MEVEDWMFTKEAQKGADVLKKLSEAKEGELFIVEAPEPLLERLI
jgi:hypothetical protein